MLKINATLLTALFVSPSPQPDKPEVLKYFKQLHYRMFPNKENFIAYIQAQNIDAQYEYATRIIQTLCFYANFPPSYYALNDVLCVESYQKNLINKSNAYIPRDHFLHIVNLYMLGIYVFFYNPEFYSKIVFENKFERHNNLFENSKLDCVKDFISEWKYFCLYHDVGYTAEILGNKDKNDSRSLIIQEITKRGFFKSSFSKDKILNHISFFNTLEIIAKTLTVQFVLKFSNEIISSKHRIFRDFKNTKLLQYDYDTLSFGVVSFDNIGKHINGKKLEKIYSNHCLKAIIPVVGEKTISVVGYLKESGKLIFISYHDGVERKLVVLSGFEDNLEIQNFIKKPRLILYDDYVSEFEVEYLLKDDGNIGNLYCISNEDNFERVFRLANYEYGKQFLGINDEQHFLDFQFDLFFWLYDKLENQIINSDLDRYLNSVSLKFDCEAEEELKFSTECYKIIVGGLRGKYLPKINEICFQYFREKTPQKLPNLPKSKRKNVNFLMTATVDQFYKSFKDFADNPKTYDELVEKVRVSQLELLEDDITLLQMYSQIYYKTKLTFSKSLDGFSYDYENISEEKSDELKKHIGEKIGDMFFGATIQKMSNEYKFQHGNTVDHGMLSAKYAARIFELYCDALNNAEYDQEKIILSILLNITGDFSEEKDKYLKNYKHIFRETLFAIYIHNLSPRYFKKNSKFKEYKTSFADPFSYLALVCDALQQWNRPHALFPSALASRPNEDASSEYNIVMRGNYIVLQEEENNKFKERLSNTIDSLVTYLNNADAYICTE